MNFQYAAIDSFTFNWLVGKSISLIRLLRDVCIIRQISYFAGYFEIRLCTSYRIMRKNYNRLWFCRAWLGTAGAAQLINLLAARYCCQSDSNFDISRSLISNYLPDILRNIDYYSYTMVHFRLLRNRSSILRSPTYRCAGDLTFVVRAPSTRCVSSRLLAIRNHHRT